MLTGPDKLGTIWTVGHIVMRSLPNGGNFVVGDWSFSGTNALDGSSSNSTTGSPMPIGTFTTSPTEGVYADLGLVL